jgi:hypothetical protein
LEPNIKAIAERQKKADLAGTSRTILQTFVISIIACHPAEPTSGTDKSRPNAFVPGVVVQH